MSEYSRGGAEGFRSRSFFLRASAPPREPVIGIQRLLQLVGEKLALHEIVFRAGFQLVLQQFLEQLRSHVLVLQPPDLSEESIIEDSDIGLFESRGGEDVDDMAFGADRLAHELADGGVDLFRCLAVLAASFVERSL